MPRINAETPDKLKVFLFHNIECAPISSKEAKGDCPFCGKQSHMFISLQTGEWECKACMEAGNTYTFLRLFHTENLRATTLDDYKELRKERPGIPISEFKEWKIARDSLTGSGEWMIPSYNTKERDPKKRKLANLYKAAQNEDGKWQVMSSPGCKLHMFGNHFANKNHLSNIIVEGAWDGPALRAILKRVDYDEDNKEFSPVEKSELKRGNAVDYFRVRGAPGAGTFDPAWLKEIENEPTIFIFDNDHPQVQCTECKKRTPLAEPKCIHCRSKKLGEKQFKPGWDGMNRIFKLMSEEDCHPPEVQRIKWGKNGYSSKLPSGFDVRDLVNREKKLDKEEYPVQVMNAIWERLEDVEIGTSPKKVATGEAAEADEQIEPIPCDRYSKLAKAFDQRLHFTRAMQDTLTVMLAVCISTELASEQLFLRVIGPPGSGKTTLAECLSAARQYVYAKSIFTGFHSGFIGGKGGRKKDRSLIPVIQNKTFIVKDADTMISAPNLDRILAELRDVYDGTSRSHYRTGIARNYEGIRTTLILCGTDDLRNLNRSFLGDRFLDCDILGDGSTEPFVESAASSAYDDITSSLKTLSKRESDSDDLPEDSGFYLKQITLGYLMHLKENLGDLIPEMPKSSKKTIKALAQFLAFMRARVRRDKEELTHRQRVELGTRLTKQLMKLAVCVAIVLSKTAVDKEVLRIIRKITLDTGVGFPLEITRRLGAKPNGLTSRQIALDLGLGETSVRRHLFNMQELKIVERGKKSNNSNVRGRDLHIWYLTKPVRNFYSIAHQKKEITS
jgi:ribosomal protein L37AE/L43A/energy-coupling factor transporter ATP-binding protein EcfA2